MISYQSKEELIQQLRAKEATAFHYIYDNYAPALFGDILREVEGDIHAAENILEEVMIDIFSSAHQFDTGKKRLFSWLITASRQKCSRHRLHAREKRQQVFRKIRDQQPDLSFIKEISVAPNQSFASVVR